MFFGEYLNGERNGYGKEVDKFDRIIYEGEYENGKRNGKWIEHTEGKVSYKGEYLYEERNGKGKEYNKFGKLVFDGEFLNGKRKLKTIKYLILWYVNFYLIHLSKFKQKILIY